MKKIIIHFLITAFYSPTMAQKEAPEATF